MEEAEQYKQACVTIDDTNISGEFVRLPSDQAYWSEQYAVALETYLQAKFCRESAESLAHSEQQILLQAAAGKNRVTVAEVESAVKRDPNYRAARQHEIIAEVNKTRIGGILDALKTKRDMLISLGAHLRADKEQTLSINQRPNYTSYQDVVTSLNTFSTGNK